MAEARAVFLEGNLFRHIAVMALTSSVGLMAVFAVDFIDMVFISMLGDAELAAAVGYVGAILFFTTSFGIGMAIAAGALVARALGQGDEELARAQAAAALMGATGETLDLAVHYLQIIVPSLPFLMVGMVGGAILRAHGDARRAMMATIWGALVNAALDPILIFGLGLDLTGAAVASVAARLVIAGTALIPIFRHHGGLVRPGISELSVALPSIVTIAAPAILTQLATPLGQAVVTRAMANFGEAAVAGMAIVGRMTPVAFGVIFALSGAIGPVIGQNFGAGRMDRVRQAHRDGVLFCGIFTMVMTVILFALRGPIIALFGAEGVTRDLLVLFCGPLGLAFFFNGVIFVANAAFNNMGHPFRSTWINWGRHTLGTVPFVLAGGAMFGAAGVLIGQAVGGVIFAAVAAVMVRRMMDGEAGTPAPEEPFDRQARLMSLMHRRR